MRKLYVVVRNDLEPGAQAAQLTHAAIQFMCSEHCSIEARVWYAESKNLVLLQVPDELALLELQRRVGHRSAAALYREPDLGDSVTAIAFGNEAGKLLGSLPLALRSEETTDTLRTEVIDGHHLPAVEATA